MANDSTIGIGVLLLLLVLLFCCCICGFLAKVCFLGVQCVFGVFSWCRCVFCYVWWEVVGC